MSVIVNVYGGLGNQMFCYAFGYAFARHRYQDLLIDTTQQDNDSSRQIEITKMKIEYVYKITFVKRKDFLGRALYNKIRLRKRIGFNTRVITEKMEYQFDESIFTDTQNYNRDVYLSGYWQSYKYFEDYRNELIKMFVPDYKQSTNAIKYLELIKNTPDSVAIHVRRGDYLNVGCNLNMLYYDTALEKISNILEEQITVFVFSDDIEYCQSYFVKYNNLHVIYVDYDSEEKTLDDFFLINACRHQIIANSSYSWWAAWLNDKDNKIVLAPVIGNWKKEFYPNEWHTIDMNI